MPATRGEALHHLDSFVPLAASHYARERNYDRGPKHRGNVSQLSAAIQRRLITEQEVLQAISKAHSLEACEKFAQEVLWRSYWKSWLELRPSVWRDYQNSLSTLLSFESPVYSRALHAQTSIECFDYWRKELFETGYLHNHARMWFASIWIFTFKLPWQLGAKLFEEELCDFDPAANTLSWRWVAGLHTPGKHYLATAQNISQYTESRFSPENQLIENAPCLTFKAPSLEPLKEEYLPFQGSADKVGLLLHPEDFSPETIDWVNFSPQSTAVLDPGLISFWGQKSSRVHAYNRKAVADLIGRHQSIGSTVELLSDGNLTEKLKGWINRHALKEIYLIKPWQGYLKDQWAVAEKNLTSQGVSFYYLRRDYDKEFSQKAHSGFFSFKSELGPVWSRIKTERNKERLWKVKELK